MEAGPASRSLDTMYQLSDTYDGFGCYNVRIECSQTLSGGEHGTVYFEECEYDQFDHDVHEISRLSNQNTGTLTVGLNHTQNITGTLCGPVRSGHYLRIRTESNVGSPVFTLVSAWECTF